jgi:hypothetical protein
MVAHRDRWHFMRDDFATLRRSAPGSEVSLQSAPIGSVSRLDVTSQFSVGRRISKGVALNADAARNCATRFG